MTVTKTPARKTRALRIIAIGVGLILALAACSKDASPPSTSGSSGASVGSSPSAGEGSDGGQVSESASPGDGSGSGDGSGDSDGQDTLGAEDDLKVFGYATTDEVELSQQVVKVGQSVSQIEQDAKQGDLEALQQDAATLERRAGKLERLADQADERQDPLDPADATLKDANGTAARAFSQTSNYAHLAAIIAGQAADPNPKTLESILRQVGQLRGQQDEVLTLYDELNESLAKWSNAHPLLAAKALATYGG